MNCDVDIEHSTFSHKSEDFESSLKECLRRVLCQVTSRGQRSDNKLVYLAKTDGNK